MLDWLNCSCSIVSPPSSPSACEQMNNKAAANKPSPQGRKTLRRESKRSPQEVYAHIHADQDQEAERSGVIAMATCLGLNFNLSLSRTRKRGWRGFSHPPEILIFSVQTELDCCAPAAAETSEYSRLQHRCSFLNADDQEATSSCSLRLSTSSQSIQHIQHLKRRTQDRKCQRQRRMWGR